MGMRKIEYGRSRPFPQMRSAHFALAKRCTKGADMITKHRLVIESKNGYLLDAIRDLVSRFEDACREYEFDIIKNDVEDVSEEESTPIVQQTAACKRKAASKRA